MQVDAACGSIIAGSGAGGEARGRGSELERSGREIGGGGSRSGRGGCSGAVSLQLKRMGSVCLGGEVIELRLRDLSAEEGSCFLGDKESEVKDKLFLEVNKELTDKQVPCFTTSTKGTRLPVQKYKY
jgi:hypothetical protein